VSILFIHVQSFLGRTGFQLHVDRRIFSYPIPQRQPHVVNLDGARHCRCLTQSKIIVARPASVFQPLRQPFPHGIHVQVFQFVVEGKAHGHESSGRGPLVVVGASAFSPGISVPLPVPNQAVSARA
jgi:hypothetical protein